VEKYRSATATFCERITYLPASESVDLRYDEVEMNL
jgi:hypothetical protein